jgi:type IX secretion system PorP/SprF family membrane protein
MKSTIVKVLAVCAGMIGATSYAQHASLVDHYYVNPFLTNPAQAGNNGSSVQLLKRSQWTDVQGMPETFIATYDGLLHRQNAGFGLTYVQDQLSVLGRTGLYGTYSYKVPVWGDGQLSMGVSLGFIDDQILVDQDDADNPNEIALIQGVQPRNNFDANAGISFAKSGFELGFAAYQLAANHNDMLNSELPEQMTYSFLRHYVATAKYRLHLDRNKIYLEPFVQGRFLEGFDPQVDMNIMLNFMDKAWIGGGYRTGFGANFMAGGYLADKLLASVSYGRPVGPLERFGANVLELSMGYRMAKKSDYLDSDKDGVMDMNDQEPNTPEGCEVNGFGVAMDDDRDGVANCLDEEPYTVYGAPVDARGVALDGDQDGVIDLKDQQANTPSGCKVDAFGVAIDTDADGVPDCLDKEVNSPRGAEVDVQGVALDTDKDGVPDFYDLESNTPLGCKVDKRGQALDADQDGVPNCLDKEMNTPRGAEVDSRGIAVDSDRDGVPNGLDMEPNSKPGCEVDKQGRCIQKALKDDDGDGVPNENDLEPNTPKGNQVDDNGRSIKPVNPAAHYKIEVEEIEDNSDEWEYYIIIGVFKNFNNVKSYQKHLLVNYDEETRVLTTPEGYYYIWSKQIRTQEEAREEKARLTSKNVEDYIVGNPWLWRQEKK